MSVNNEYKRYFIILQEDDKGYEISPGKIPTGYVKVEIKNGKAKLTAFIQNVKNADKIEYRFLLIAASKKTAVDIGKFVIDSSGRGELHYEFESDNVLRSSLDISQFTIAAVESSSSTPLSGYLGRDKLEWKNTYEIINRVEPKERIDKVKEKIENIVTPITQKPLITEQAPIIKEKVQEIVEQIPIIKDPLENIVEQMPEVKIPVENTVQQQVFEVKEEIEKTVNEMPMVMEQAENIVQQAQEAVEQIEEVIENVPEMLQIAPKPIENITENLENIVNAKAAPSKKILDMPFIKAEFMMETKLKAEPVVEKKREDVYKEPDLESRHAKEHCGSCSLAENTHIDYKSYYYDEDDEEDYGKHKKDEDNHKKQHDEQLHKVENQTCEEQEEAEDDCDNNAYYYQSPLYRKLEKVFDRLKSYEPFDEKEKSYKWFKVEDDIYLLNSASIPFMGAMMPLGYPFMMEECALMIGKKDYIIGVKYDRISKRDDKKYARLVCYGVPGIYNKREEMYYRMRGYSHFKPHKSRNYGYWIMCVDIRTGQVMM